MKPICPVERKQFFTSLQGQHRNHNVPESYVHRIGRTARAGSDGIAIAFCDKEERSLLKDIEKLMKLSIPKEDAGAEYTEIAREKAALVRSQPNGQRGRSGGRGRGKSGGGGQSGNRRNRSNGQGRRNGGGGKAQGDQQRPESGSQNSKEGSSNSSRSYDPSKGSKPKRLKPRHNGQGGQRGSGGSNVGGREHRQSQR